MEIVNHLRHVKGGFGMLMAAKGVCAQREALKQGGPDCGSIKKHRGGDFSLFDGFDLLV